MPSNKKNPQLRTERIVSSLDLSILYQAAAIPLVLDFKRDANTIFVRATQSQQRNDRALNLIEGVENCGADMPLDQNGKQTLSGMQLFNLVRAWPDYYPSYADVKIQNDNLNRFADLLEGTTLIELCAGRSDKTVDLIKNIRAINPAAKGPKRVYSNDLFPENTKTSVTNIKGLNYSLSNLVSMTGNVLDRDLWVRANTQATYDKAEKSVVLMQGATFNDFSIDEMQKILGFFHLLPKNTVFVLSVDNTTDVETLQKAYDNPLMRQFALTGVEHYRYIRSGSDFRTEVIPFEPARAKSLVNIGKDGAYTNITLSVEDPHYLHPFNPIRKLPTHEMSQMIKDAKVEIVERLSFNDPSRFSKVDHSFYVLQLAT